MNVYKVKNQPKLLSRFNSISQPQLSAIIGTESQQQSLQALPLQEHTDTHNNASRKTDWSYDVTKRFLGQVKWSQQVSSLRFLISNSDKDESEQEERLTDSGDSELSSNSDEFFQDHFPMLVRVVKGSYGIIKENESTLAKKYVNNLLLCGKTRSMFILCQSIKFKDKKPFIYGKNISIPITYVSILRVHSFLRHQKCFQIKIINKTLIFNRTAGSRSCLKMVSQCVPYSPFGS